MADAALELSHVSAGYGETVVLEDVSLALAPGESISVIGRNGVGKTTLLATVMGHTTLHAGELTLHRARLDRVPVFRRALRGLGWVPQEREIFPSLSVRENLEVGARPGPWTLSRVFELFPRLEARLSNMGSQLSGGEQQMLSIGRALMTNPKLLILDEATEGLAPLIVAEIWRVIAAVRGTGISTLIVDRDYRKVLAHTDRAVVMEKGRIVLADDSARLAADTAALTKFLGV